LQHHSSRLPRKEKAQEGKQLKAGIDTETRELHQMSKEWLALREDLIAFHTQLQFLRDAHNELLAKAAAWEPASVIAACNPFDVLVSHAEICSRWTMVYRDRTDICIQMACPHLSPPLITHANTQPSSSTSRTNASQSQAAKSRSKRKKTPPP
jgi:hypothetical protein